MSYNLEVFNATSNTNWLEVIQQVNVQSEYLFGILFLIAIWLLFFLAFKKEESIVEWIMSSLLTSIIAMLMLFGGWLPWMIAVLPMFALFVAIIIYFFS
jgi:hypothetical protein